MSSVLEKIYRSSPVAVQNLAISAYGLNWYRRRYGGQFMHVLKEAKDREDFSEDRWRDYQTAQLRKILAHAFNNVPYYRDSLSNAGLDLRQLMGFEIDDLTRLPILEKEDLRQFGTSSLLAAKKEKGGSFFSSSGSTGTPTRILYSHLMHQRVAALYEARVRNWAGLSKKDPRAMIGGRRVVPKGNALPPYYRYNFVEKQLYLSAYHISPQNASNYLQGIMKFGSRYMVGYAVSNYLLASFLQQTGLEVPQMKAVLTSSEKLTRPMRKTLEQTYQCKVYDGWSGVENCGLISENEFGQLLISPDAGILEILNSEGQPCLPGETGELICTGFLNYDQPLIRYRIGDMVQLAKDQNTLCGRNMKVISEITGRTEDLIVGPDGRAMVRFHGVFIDLPNVIKGQIVQESESSFTINVVSNTALPDREKNLIIERMKSQLGEQIDVHVNHLNEIPISSNGKFKAVVSKLKMDTYK